MPEIFAVNPERLNMFWGKVIPFIESALAANPYETTQDIHDAIARKEAVLWIVWDRKILAVAVTFLTQRPRAKVCSIFLCTGTERERWDHQLVARLEEYARAEQCSLMRHEAREGWRRVLKPLGYQCTHVILEKAL